MLCKQISRLLSSLSAQNCNAHTAAKGLVHVSTLFNSMQSLTCSLLKKPIVTYPIPQIIKYREWLNVSIHNIFKNCKKNKWNEEKQNVNDDILLWVHWKRRLKLKIRIVKTTFFSLGSIGQIVSVCSPDSFKSLFWLICENVYVTWYSVL